MDADLKQKLIDLALQARHWAYAPYSHYAVGAALVTTSGKIYDGANVENASYPNSCCAERVAIFKAISEGEREFDTLVVATENGGSPCGMCRQVMAEFGLDTRVIIIDGAGKIRDETTVAALLPEAFTPKDLI
jgi:cytidine deaminase